MQSTIEVRVDRIGQLFESFDPMPFRERDLDRNAEEYIVGWARELPRRDRLRILVHMPAAEAAHENAADLHGAFRRFFRYRAEAMTGNLAELFRIGRYSLCVGLAVLASCVLIARYLPLLPGARHYGPLAQEGLVILGWVANWRPIEIFLYDWWPLVRRRNLFVRLADAEVELAPR